MENYKVYVQTNEDGCITAINSDAFLPDVAGWMQVDAGEGDRYHHAQGNYLPGPLMANDGCYAYKLVNGKPVERTEEELAAERATVVKVPMAEERLAALEAAMLAMMEG